MNNVLAGLLLLVFLVHLAVFSRLAIRRKEGYYLALVLTFSLLSVSAALRLWPAEMMLMGEPLAQWFRRAALAAAVVSISWGLVRFIRRWRRRTRQES